MISSLFVDRPRLAIVIALIITIAGGLALLRIPIAQFPDIVPPRVSVSGMCPGTCTIAWVGLRRVLPRHPFRGRIA